MKQKICVFLCSIFILGLVGCGSDQSPEPSGTIVSDPEVVSDAIEEQNNNEQEKVVIEGEEEHTPKYEMVPQGEVKFSSEKAVFEYTEEEIKAYEEFSKDFDKSAFKDL